ncbi:MAG: hypothetical protein Q9159_004173 [Coniocarpon cinnabarinum]
MAEILVDDAQLGSRPFPTHSLPSPRSHPLKPGSTKETAFINHVDTSIARLQGRFAKREYQKGPLLEIDDETLAAALEPAGYRDFKEAGEDIERVLDIVWVSGTPSLQVPYMLNLALLLVTFIEAFSPPSPTTMFRLLNKMDMAFAGLIQGRDSKTDKPLPGTERRTRLVSGTEKVRMKSLVEKTRIVVVAKMGEGGVVEDEDSISYDIDDEYDMDVARVYDRVMSELGDELGEVDLNVA